MSNPFKITILVLPDSSLMTVASVIEPWRALNRVSGSGHADWRVVTLDGGPVALSNGLLFPTQGALDRDASGDLLVVVAAFNVLNHVNRAISGLLRRILPRFNAVAGVESGAWMLGSLGALDGKRATAHWEDLEDFAAAHPETDVRADRWVISGRVMTAGGASPAFDLMLHLIRGSWGEAVALDVASVFIYDETLAATERQPLVSMGRLASREPRVAAVVRLMEATLDQPFSIEALARKAGVTVRRLEMLFRDTLGTSPGAYYTGLRLSAARRLVTDTTVPLAEVALRTGFSSPSAFSRAFRRHTGMTAQGARAAAKTDRAHS